MKTENLTMNSIEEMLQNLVIYLSVSMTAFFLFYITLNTMYNKVAKRIKVRRNNEHKQIKR